MKRIPTWAREVVTWLSAHPSEPFRTVQSTDRCVLAFRVGRQIHVMDVTVEREFYLDGEGR